MKRKKIWLLGILSLTTLVSCGTQGIPGEKGETGLKGDPGKDGVSIVSVVKTSSDGNIDLYTISYSDGTTSCFNITNGKDGSQGEHGVAGKDGIGIKNVFLDNDLNLIIVLDNGETINAGKITNNNNDDNFTYSLRSDNTYQIDSYNGDDETIEIPNVFDNKPVTSIAAGVFKNNVKIKSVSIPDSITEIGYECFCNCSKLEVFDIGMSSELRIIYSKAFENCSKLESFYFPRNIEYIGSESFYNSSLISANFASSTIRNLRAYSDGYPYRFRLKSNDKCAQVLVNKSTFSLDNKSFTVNWFQQDWLHSFATEEPSGTFLDL